jgi:hypothetical protein
VLPAWAEAPQANPKQAIRGVGFGLAGLAMEHGELMTEGQLLQRQARMGLAARVQGPQERENHSEHDRANFCR